YTATNSLIDGLNEANNGNIDATGMDLDHIFADPNNGDYSLINTSPAINAGDNTLYTGDINTDLDVAGNDRVYDLANGGVIDMGAYEVQNNAPVAACHDITVALDENGTASITANDIDNGSYDDEDNTNLTLSIDTTDFDCNHIGDNSVILTVEDSN